MTQKVWLVIDNGKIEFASLNQESANNYAADLKEMRGYELQLISVNCEMN